MVSMEAIALFQIVILSRRLHLNLVLCISKISLEVHLNKHQSSQHALTPILIEASRMASQGKEAPAQKSLKGLSKIEVCRHIHDNCRALCSISYYDGCSPIRNTPSFDVDHLPSCP